MLSFIAICEDGSIIYKESAKEAFDLPGKKEVFTVGTPGNYKLNEPDGVCYFSKADKPSKFKIGNLELVDLKHNGSVFNYVVYDHLTREHHKKNFVSKKYGEFWKEILNYFVIASKFPDLKTYNEYVDLKKENTRLKREIEQLKK